ncbi:DMT family transporter [Sphingorhabdus sp. Alg239-R122]|uniref:DMT family transporter n=1 Tax=Sphingorhabdus sp. Alg239-R122 TaxID=2305989 RepID=UPI0013D9678E|nr:DMT family transporter [Sphingorhabdus sp. Alg239-R122]
MNTAARHSDHAILPFLAVATGIATFGGMDALMKGLALALGTYNALLWRCGAAVVMAAVLFAIRPSKWPEKAALRLHVLRGSITSVMAFTFFWGLARTPIAEAIAISFIAPIIALYLAAVMLGERVGRSSIFASVLGLSGVIVIVAGKLGQDFDSDAKWGIAAILTSAVLYAFNLILQRQQAQIASPVEIGLFQNGIVTAILLLFAPFFAVVPDFAEHGPAIVGAAALALVSLLLISWGYAREQAQALVPIEYSAFIWAIIFGWIFFAEPVTAATLIGAVLIVGGCLIVARRRPEMAEPEQVAL